MGSTIEALAVLPKANRVDAQVTTSYSFLSQLVFNVIHVYSDYEYLHITLV